MGVWTTPFNDDLSLRCGNLSGQSLEVLKKEFSNIRNKYNGRYIRLYGACEQNGY